MVIFVQPMVLWFNILVVMRTLKKKPKPRRKLRSLLPNVSAAESHVRYACSAMKSGSCDNSECQKSFASQDALEVFQILCHERLL